METKKKDADNSISTERLEAFSDGVFAIVITLLFFDLRPPHIDFADDWRLLYDAIIALTPQFLSIIVSFTFVAIFWVAHHQFFHTLKSTTRNLLWLNLIFLFLVCFVPFPAAIMSQYPQNKTSVVFFGATVLLTSLLLLSLRWYAWIKHPEISGLTDDSFAGKSIRRSIIIVCLYVSGLAVSFFHPVSAIVLYLLTPITLMFPVRVEVETASDDDETKTVKL